MNFIIKQMIISCALRIELFDLNEKIPPFNKIYVSFLKSPFFDFTFQFGPFILSYIGFFQYNLGNFINYMIIKTSKNMALFPKKIEINLPPSQMKINSSNSIEDLKHINQENINVEMYNKNINNSIDNIDELKKSKKFLNRLSMNRSISNNPMIKLTTIPISPNNKNTNDTNIYDSIFDDYIFDNDSNNSYDDENKIFIKKRKSVKSYIKNMLYLEKDKK